MMSRAPRWKDIPGSSKTNNSSQKTGGKEPPASTSSLPSGGKQAANSVSKTRVGARRSHSLGRGGDSAGSGSKSSGSLRRDQASRQSSGRSALRLCSSFSSLHTPSLSAPAFVRSSRSLSRLDQRSSGDDAVPRTHVRNGRALERRGLSSDHLFSEEHIRDNEGHCGDDNSEKMKTSSSSVPLESCSSTVSTAECHHHCNSLKKQEWKRSSLPRYRGLQSLQVRGADASAVPDLLDFKKGWMMLQDASGQWQRHWFVLTDQNLKFYKDSVAEEAAGADGEINLSTCFDITENPAQKDSGFQIHTRDGVYTLCAMTSGMRRNWVQAVLKNVKTGHTADVNCSVPVQPSQQKSQQQELQSAVKTEHQTNDCALETLQDVKLQPEQEQSSADGGSASSTLFPAISSPRQVGGCECGAAQTVEADPSSSVEGGGGDSSASIAMLSIEEGAAKTEQAVTTATKTEEQQDSSDVSQECMKLEDPREQRTWQLVKELEQTQKELSRLQEHNRNLQDELQQARESHSVPLQTPLEALALQRLQKVNEDLRSELEAQKKNQEEARETELRRRVDLLAQQAQLLVTGDATALAQTQMEQERRRFYQLQVEWERCVASLKSQLSFSEEQRKEAESHHTRLQQELQNFHNLQEEAERLQQNLQEVTKQLRANEEAQAQKETRLQKHLMLLQASQDRERRSLTASLAQAEQHSQDLQERLDRAEQQLDSLTKSQSWTREIETAQQQLQEELERTMAAVQDLQEEKEQLDRRCQELQNQLLEADEEVSRLQNRLTSDETHYYNLEHTYERVCEELQMALGKVQQKEAEAQEMREGYERLLDGKEQELSEVLLKMEVLGNSLEDTELKLNEMLNVCTCASSQVKEESSEPERQEQTTDLEVNNGLQSSYQSLVAAGDDPERFMTVIQTLENKLYVTEEKLRDIMQRLEEQQSHLSCQDPQLCSQLTQSRATAQHLSLLLHSQAKQSQRFAQETESRCRVLASRLQVALNIVQACRGRLEMTPVSVPELERQLATIAACLQQGEKEVERQQLESRNANKGEEKILNDETLTGAENKVSTQSKFMLPSEDDEGTVGRCLLKELFVVEKMVSVLQNQHGIRQLVPTEDEEGVVHRYKSIISQTIVLKTENSRAECDDTERAIDRVCAEAELIYAAFKHLQEFEVNDQDEEALRTTLADVCPPELAPYEEQEKDEDEGSDEADEPLEKDESDLKEAEGERESDWLDRLISHLQRRAKCLRQLCQETSDGEERRMRENWEIASVAGLKWIEEQAKLIYLSARMSLDLEQESRRRKVLQEQLQALCNVQHVAIKEELEAFNHTLCRLQEDNSVLREELERAEQKIISVETGNQRLQEDIQKIQDYHKERMQKLEVEFQEKIKELQHIHEEEMKHLHGFYSKSCASKEKQTRSCTGSAPSLLEHTETKEASSEESLPAVEEVHRKLIGDLEQQHQLQVAALLKEKEQLLQDETAATMAAIVAMRRAHKQELEKSRQAQQLRENADVTELHVQHEKEMQLLQKELEALSVQHTQKCLENSQLQQELHDERQSLMQCQKENQELQKKQRETDETSLPLFSLNGKQSHVASHVDDFYEMEVILRAREAEMQFLRQEAHALREELKIARMDKMYAQNKLQALCTKAQDESGRNVSKGRDETKFATWSYSRNAPRQDAEDTVTALSGAALLKKTVKSSLTRQIRGVRSKSLKEGLSTQEKMKLFESF